jgi:DNA helicase-2/ATP-dependent DNA helicase PcrA
MRVLADLHIHSPFSRATSRELRIETLHLWAQKKGVRLLGTGDFTHPTWLREILEKLEPAEEGFWRLRPELARVVDREVPESCRADVRFVLQGEISTIYKKDGRTRKVHHLVLLPDRSSAERLIMRLERVGNLRGDGRPILGLDSRDLLEMVLDASQEGILVPAHVWTPWFSVFGSRSGFEGLEECYADLTGHVTALETGLSSDPAMNWRCSWLDSYQLISNSDAHSPSRLGREANWLDIPICFSGLRKALDTGDGLLGTIEFFPEEGKYHLDGHRACAVRMDPGETIARGGLCPSCGKPVTVGVLHRVDQLADRQAGFVPKKMKPFHRLLPLEEVLGELLGCGPSSRKVQELYHKLLCRWGPEIPLLSELPLESLREASMKPLAEALDRMRRGKVFLEPGFDGQYGVVRLFDPAEVPSLGGQMSLMKELDLHPRSRPKSPSVEVREKAPTQFRKGPAQEERTCPQELDPSQQAAVFSPARALLVIAGPGTGKTRVLTSRLAWFLKTKKASPQEVLAVTFTQRAAMEMAQRLAILIGEDLLRGLSVQTLHSYGLSLIRAHWDRLSGVPGPMVADDSVRMAALQRALESWADPRKPQPSWSLLERVSNYKQGLLEGDREEVLMERLARAYDQELRSQGAVDYEDLLILPLQLMEGDPEVKAQVRARVRYLFVDEFQDLNPRQLALLRELMGPQTQITLIGDPDQSIYGFRGAEPRHFLRLTDLIPDMEVMALGTNYRSTANIAQGAFALISHNPALFARHVGVARGPGPTIQVRVFDSDQMEAIFVAQEMDRLLGGTSHWAMLREGHETYLEQGSVGFGDMAVLCRLHSLLPRVQEALARQGIPSERVAGGAEEPDKAMRELLGELRRLLGRPCRPEKVWEIPVLESIPTGGRPSSTGPAGAAVRAFMKELGMAEPGSGISMGLEQSQLRRFLEAADTWPGDLLELLDHWIMLVEENQPQPPADKVSLMTVHGAKGLEFRVIFVVGCDEDIFPLRQQTIQGSLEEERRIFYVAMTRAKDLLYLTATRSRCLPGGTRAGGPSRFLQEIPAKLVSMDQQAHGQARSARQLSLFRGR